MTNKTLRLIKIALIEKAMKHKWWQDKLSACVPFTELVKKTAAKHRRKKREYAKAYNEVSKQKGTK